MFKVLDEVCVPTKGSKYSACIDLYAREDVVIGAGETVKVPLGVYVDLEELKIKLLEQLPYGQELNLPEKTRIFLASHYLQLEPRSSLRAKGLQAGTGIIDIDYKDEICIILHNPHEYIECEYWVSLDGTNSVGLPAPQPVREDYTIKKGDKIAQIMLCEHKSYLLGIETEQERSGGFGSTGN